MKKDKNNKCLTFIRFSVVNEARCYKHYHNINDWSPTDWACAVAGEVGEMCNYVKKLRRLEDKNCAVNEGLFKEDLMVNIGKELADIVIYADLLATRLGMNLSTEIIKKFNETSDKIDSGLKL